MELDTEDRWADILTPMLWFFLSLFGAVFTAVMQALTKKFQQKTPYLVLAAGTYTVTAAILLIASYYKGLPVILPGFYTAVIATTGINVVATILFCRALDTTDFSLVMPIMSFTPVVLTISSFFLLREAPSVKGLAGILLTVVGLYVLNLKQDAKSWLSSFQELVRHAGVRDIFIVTVLYGISSSFDKMTVQTSDIYFSSGFTYALLAIIFIVLSLISHRRDAIFSFQHAIQQYVISGILTVLVAVAINYAFLLQLSSYVLSIKRLSALFGVLIAYFNGQNIRR